MNEAEWLASADPMPMLAFLGRIASDRKNRLLSLACCRRFSDTLQAPELRHALTVADRLADGNVDAGERKAARRAAHLVIPHQDLSGAAWVVQRLLRKGTLLPGEMLMRLSDARRQEAFLRAHRNKTPPSEAKADEALRAELQAQCELVLECFGNPFRPVAAHPSWLTSTVVALANGIYNEKAFDRMPILADALQDAGCDNEDILNHCRGPGPHVRGCWVIDLLLGKG